MKIADLLAKLEGVTKTASGWTARCPAHDDRNPSLSIAEKDGKILFHCFAGCSFDAICAALGINKRDLFDSQDRPEPQRSQLTKAYDYTDPEGKLLYQVCRYTPKDFRQRRPDGRGGWLWNMQDVHRVLYRLPDVMKAVAEGRDIYIVEGEKDADALVALGLCATCNAGGAGKWKPEYSDTLAGARVIILPDKDGPGRRHAAMVQAALDRKAVSIKVVELPDRDGESEAQP